MTLQAQGRGCHGHERSAPAALAGRHPPLPLRTAASATELLDGRPHGDEGELLQHFEAEVDQSVQHLRELKQGNEQAQAAIGELVQQIAAAHDSFESQRLAVAGELARLQQAVAQHEQDAGQALPELPDGG